MKKLRLGKMTMYELADWFGIEYQSLMTMKDSKLERLKDFCDYEKYQGGVEIFEIYKEVYEKKVNRKKKEVKEKKKKVKTKKFFQNGQWVEREIG